MKFHSLENHAGTAIYWILIVAVSVGIIEAIVGDAVVGLLSPLIKLLPWLLRAGGLFKTLKSPIKEA